MKMTNSVSALICVAVASSLFFGCSKKEESAPVQQTAAPATETQAQQPAQALSFVKFGPTDVKAGTDFNVQANGVSALWAAGENITPSTIIVINNVKLRGFPGDKGSITTPVPKDLYAKAGEYPIYLLDTKTGAKSNELKFVVK